MRVAAVAALLALASASPAAALGIGPELRGDAVLWGEERDGSVRLLERTAAGTQVLWRRADPPGRKRSYVFGGLPGALTASDRWLSFNPLVDQIVEQGSDYVASTIHGRLLGSHDGGPYRSALPACGPSSLAGADADGDVLAAIYMDAKCDGERQYGSYVYVVEGDGEPRRFARFGRHEQSPRQVRVAGDRVAWGAGDDDAIVVADRASGEVVETLTNEDFGRRFLREFALDADGNLIAEVASFDEWWLVLRNLDSGDTRTLARGGYSAETSAGRVAYFRANDLFVRDLDGTLVRRIAAGTGRRSPFDLDLDEDQVAWSTLDERTRDLRVKVVRLLG